MAPWNVGTYVRFKRVKGKRADDYVYNVLSYLKVKDKTDEYEYTVECIDSKKVGAKAGILGNELQLHDYFAPVNNGKKASGTKRKAADEQKRKEVHIAVQIIH